MGHIRLGHLPKSRQWSQVVALLDDPEADAEAIARAAISAAVDSYRLAGADLGLVESLRTMAVLANASRSEDFEAAVAAAGLPAAAQHDAVSFLVAVFQDTERRFGPNAQRTIFSEFALAALQESISRNVATQTRTLFLSGVDDVRDAYRAFSSDRGFAKLARQFFATFLSRSLRYFMDQEAPNRVGGEGRFGTQADLRAFYEGVDTYAFEAARIVEDFAGGWYAKRRWLGGVEDTDGLAAVAMRKLADELALAR